MNEFWQTELTEEQKESMIQQMADKIVRRRLEAPAILALEMHMPVSNLGANAAIAFSPFLVPFLGFDNVNNYSQFFAERDNIRRLIDEIEQRRDGRLGNKAIEGAG